MFIKPTLPARGELHAVPDVRDLPLDALVVVLGLFNRIRVALVAHLILLLLGRPLQELEVELLHVGALQPAGLLLAAVLVDAVLEGAPLAQRAQPAGVPLGGNSIGLKMCKKILEKQIYPPKKLPISEIEKDTCINFFCSMMMSWAVL